MTDDMLDEARLRELREATDRLPREVYLYRLPVRTPRCSRCRRPSRFPLVRPSKDIRELEVKSIRKKWKDKAFAAGVNRDEIEEAVAELGVDLWEFHVPLVMKSMQSHADELGLAGVGA